MPSVAQAGLLSDVRLLSVDEMDAVSGGKLSLGTILGDAAAGAGIGVAVGGGVGGVIGAVGGAIAGFLSGLFG